MTSKNLCLLIVLEISNVWDDLRAWKWVVLLLVVEVLRLYVEIERVGTEKDMVQRLDDIYLLFVNMADYFAPNAPRG